MPPLIAELELKYVDGCMPEAGGRERRNTLEVVVDLIGGKYEEEDDEDEDDDEDDTIDTDVVDVIDVNDVNFVIVVGGDDDDGGKDGGLSIISTVEGSGQSMRTFQRCSNNRALII